MQVTSTSFRAYAIDLWGFGDTANSPLNYLVEAQVRLLERFMHELGIAKVGLVGHGLGAVISLLFALKNPAQVDRLMTISIPPDLTGINTRLRSIAPLELVDWLLSTDSIGDPVRAEVPKSDPKAIETSLNDFHDLNITGSMRQLTIPCLMVHGENDPLIALPEENKLASLSGNTHRIILDGTGHFPMLEQQNKFNRLLVDFLALQSGEPPSNLQLKDEWKRRVR